MGVENEDGNVFLAANTIDCRTSRVTGGCSHDVHLLSSLFQEVFEDIAEELKRHVLESQGRPVEQFDDRDVVFGNDRGDLGVVKTVIGAIDEFFQVVGRNVVTEQGDNLEGKFAIRQAPPCFQLPAIEKGNFLW